MIPQCTRYKIIDEEDRRSTIKGDISYCDSSKSSGDISPNWKGAGWYRFQHPAGNKLAQSLPGYNHCGTSGGGWSDSTLPDKPGDSGDIKICFYGFLSGVCSYSNEGKVTNCGSYYVYYLENTPRCNSRYCATN